MNSTRSLLLLALAMTILFGVSARLWRYAPGDPQIARVVQSAVPVRAWIAPMLETASAPLKYGLMAIALLGAWRLAGTRAALIVLAAIVLEQLLGESSKLLFGRPRPSREIVAVMGNPTGLSFPSTFMTLYSVTVGALVVLAWRARPSPVRTAVLVVGPLVLLLAGAARVVPGAHWPSDVVGTVAILTSWLAVAFSAAGVPKRRATA
jgi:undecaprenyl-diphosphatase